MPQDPVKNTFTFPAADPSRGGRRWTIPHRGRILPGCSLLAPCHGRARQEDDAHTHANLFLTGPFPAVSGRAGTGNFAYEGDRFFRVVLAVERQDRGVAHADHLRVEIKRTPMPAQATALATAYASPGRLSPWSSTVVEGTRLKPAARATIAARLPSPP